MDEAAVYIILALVLMWAWSRYQRCRYERFSMPNKPFEPDNVLLNRNPFDDMDYIVPTFRRTDDLSILGLDRNPQH